MKPLRTRILATLVAFAVAFAALVGLDAVAANAAVHGKQTTSASVKHHSAAKSKKSKKKHKKSKKHKKKKKSKKKHKKKKSAKRTVKSARSTKAAKASRPTAPRTSSSLAGRDMTAGTYYVAANGSDSPNAGTQAQPWRTVQYAVDRAPANSAIRVAAGQYAPFVVRRSNLTVVGVGTASSIVGNSAVRDNVSIEAPNVQVSSFAITNCVPKVVAGDGMENEGAAGVAINKLGDNAVVSGNVIVGKTANNQYKLPFGCYGVVDREADGVLIEGNDISHGGYGVMLRRVGKNTILRNNEIHDVDTMIRNTPKAGDDFGGSGVGLNVVTTGSVDIVGNRIHDNEATMSKDYTTDGGAFDFFQSSNVSIRNNTIYNNENVLEGGAGSGGSCTNDSFTGNNVSGKTEGGRTLRMTVGMLMRCGAGMKITGNTFTNLQWWTFAIEPQNRNNAMMRGLTVTGNTIKQAGDLVWSMPFDPSGAQYSFSGNSYSYSGYLAQDWKGRKYRGNAEFSSAMAAAS